MVRCDRFVVDEINQVGRRQRRLVGAENPVTLCDLHVFADEAIESISPERPDGRSGTWWSAVRGCALIEGSVRPVGVEVLDVLAQHDVEVAWSDDQEVVEAFSAQGADEAFRDRVRPRCPDRGADDPHVSTDEDGVERGGELAVPVADQEPEPVGAFAEVHEQVAGLLGDPGAGGVGGDPGEVHVASPCSITTRI